MKKLIICLQRPRNRNLTIIVSTLTWFACMIIFKQYVPVVLASSFLYEAIIITIAITETNRILKS